MEVLEKNKKTFFIIGWDQWIGPCRPKNNFEVWELKTKNLWDNTANTCVQSHSRKGGKMQQIYLKKWCSHSFQTFMETVNPQIQNCLM